MIHRTLSCAWLPEHRRGCASIFIQTIKMGTHALDIHVFVWVVIVVVALGASANLFLLLFEISSLFLCQHGFINLIF